MATLMATGLPDYTDHPASYNLDDKFPGAANANGDWTVWWNSSAS